MTASGGIPLAQPGDRIGPYEIVAPLGTGGMGQVYKARDARLSRFVAIKILSPAAHGDPDRLRRFEQEARAASALNHPNILTIYEIGVSEKSAYIAMEYIEGRTLRQILAAGPLTGKTLLDYAIQISEGLAKAHAAGIVHRDLKPENLMVTRDGYVKILDFGLAKLIDPLADEGRSLSETITDSATRPGTLLGTVSYMSPEQARGERTDFRSDIFSFGSVLYEMASGRRAFRGRSSVDTLSQILNDSPPPLPPAAPELAGALPWIVGKCLAKPPEERYQSTRDLALDLKKAREELTSTSSTARLSSGIAGELRRRARMAAAGKVLAGLLLIGAIAAAYRIGRGASSGVPDDTASDVMRLTRDGAMNRAPAIAPDGKSYVFESSREGFPRLYLQYFSGGSPTRVTRETDAAVETYPAWSPDGSQIAYQRESSGGVQIALTAPVGGRPVIAVSSGMWPAWAADGRTLYYVRPGEGSAPPELRAHPVPGGSESRVCALTDRDGPPATSPDGQRIGFVRFGRQDEFRPGVYAVELPSGQPRRVLSARAVTPRTRIAWFPDAERFVVSRDNGSDEGSNLWIADLSGHIRRRLTNASAHFFNPALSRDGALLLADPYEEYETLWRIPLRGSAEENTKNASRLTAGRVSESDPDLSPDQTRIVFTSNRDGTPKLWSLELASGEMRPLEYGPMDSYCGAYSPSGRQIAFFSRRSGRAALWTMSADGAGATLREGTLLYPDSSGSFALASPVWTSENAIAFAAQGPEGTTNLYAMELGGGAPRKLESRASYPVRLPAGGLAAIDWSGGAPRLRSYGGGEPRDLGDAAGLLADPATAFWRAAPGPGAFLCLREGPAARSGIGYDLHRWATAGAPPAPLTHFSSGGLEYQFCVARDGNFVIGTREEAIADIVRIELPSEKARR